MKTNRLKLWHYTLGGLLILALAIPMAACSSGESTSATTSQTSANTTKTTTQTSATSTAATTSATTTKTTTAATTTKTTTAATTSATTSTIKKFTGLDDIPELTNKTQLTCVFEAGGHAALIGKYLPQFIEKTGVPIQVEQLQAGLMYQKQNMDMVSGAGSYDTLIVETAWNNEWARFCHPVYELAAAYDPQGVAGLEADLAGHAVGNLRCASFNDGTLVGMPFSSFQGQMYIRQDLIDDPTEKAAFKAKYGYDLGVPTTQAEQSDLGEFFTRGEGELLKGVPLGHDFYGLAIMAGAYQLNDVVCCRIWPEGADYASPVRDANGKLTEFVITKKDKAAIQNALSDIKAQIAYCSPGSYTADFDGPPQQMSMGLTACVCETYAPLDQWGFQVEKNVPGAKMAIYMTVGNQPYTGCYSMNVQKTSKNPEAAYWLQRYIGCYEVQKEMSEGGWQGVRTDVYADPKYQTEEWRTVIGARAKYCNDVWAATGKYINDYFFFNSDVAGAIYDMQILVLNRAITGELSVADTVSSLNQQTMELQRKFGTLPIREET